MLAMKTVSEIHRLKHEEKKTYQEIQDELGVSPKTISKALNRPEEFVDGYRRTKPVPRRKIGDFVDLIEELLTGKTWARKLKGRRPRRTARWVYKQIKAKGYTGAESTVRAYIRQRFKRPKPACPIEHLPAEEAQFDFGFMHVKVGTLVTLIAFVGVVFCYSTRRFLFAYPAERQECLFDAMEKAYQIAEGVTVRATLDNTRLAVKKILEGRNRLETQAYSRFRTLLGLTPRFTNPGAGWEKGHVEGTVGWAKRQVLMDLEVADWDELKRVIDEACDQDAWERSHGESGKLVQELFEEECGLFRPFPYEGRRSYKLLRPLVSPGGLVYVDGVRYSVPIALRGRRVRVQLFWDEVVITFNGEEVVRWNRDWSPRAEHYNVEHYLGLLKRAPALLEHGKPFARMPGWLHKTRLALDDDKSLVELLLAVDRGKYTFAEFERACLAAIESGCVTRCVIEQQALIDHARDRLEVPPLDDKDCLGFGQYDFAIESPEQYDEIIEGAAKKEVA